MVLGAQPLLNEDGDEQGGQCKIDAGEVQREISQQGADSGAQHPVALVKQGYQKIVADAVDPVREYRAGDQRIGFIGQCENQIGLFLPRLLVGIHHGQPIEEMPRVDHQRGQRGGSQTGATRQQLHAHILHGAGVNKDAHGDRPGQPVAVLL